MMHNFSFWVLICLTLASFFCFAFYDHDSSISEGCLTYWSWHYMAQNFSANYCALCCECNILCIYNIVLLANNFPQLVHEKMHDCCFNDLEFHHVKRKQILMYDWFCLQQKVDNSQKVSDLLYSIQKLLSVKVTVLCILFVLWYNYKLLYNANSFIFTITILKIYYLDFLLANSDSC